MYYAGRLPKLLTLNDVASPLATSSSCLTFILMTLSDFVFVNRILNTLRRILFDAMPHITIDNIRGIDNDYEPRRAHSWLTVKSRTAFRFRGNRRAPIVKIFHIEGYASIAPCVIVTEGKSYLLGEFSKCSRMPVVMPKVPLYIIWYPWYWIYRVKISYRCSTIEAILFTLLIYNAWLGWEA